MDMSYPAMNKRYKYDVNSVLVYVVENINTGLILPHLASCLDESELEGLRKKLVFESKRYVNQILLEKLVTKDYWWKYLKNALVAIKSEKVVTHLGWPIDEIDAEVSHDSQRVKTNSREELTTSKPVVTGSLALDVIQDVMDENMKVMSNDANFKESSEAKMEQTTIDNHAVQDIEPSKDEGKLTIDPNVRRHLPLTPESNNHGNIAKPVVLTLKEIDSVQQSPPCPSNIPSVESDVQECALSEIFPEANLETNDRYNIIPSIHSQEPGSLSTNEMPSLDENIFDGDKSFNLNSFSSTSTVDPQGHLANGRMRGEVFIAPNKMNVTTDLNVVVQDISSVSGASFKESSEAKVEQTTIDNHAVHAEPSKDEGKLTIDPNVRKYLPLKANTHGNIAKPVEPTLFEIEPVQQSPPCLIGPSNISPFHTESYENIFDGDKSLILNSLSSTSTVDPQGHSANGRLKDEIFIPSNKMNVTTEPRFETEESMASPYVTTLHGSFTDSESVDSQDIRSGCSDQQLHQQQVLCIGNTLNPEIATDFESSTEAPLDIQQTQACQSSDGTRAQSLCISQKQEGSNVYPLALSDSATHPVVNSDPNQSSTIRSLGSSVTDSHICYPPMLSEQRTCQSASLSGLDPPEGCNQSDIPALSIFEEYSPPAPISQEVPLVLPSERQQDLIDLNSSVVQESDLNSAAHPVVNSVPDSDIFYPPSLSEQRTDQSASQSGRYSPEGCQEDLIDLNSSVERRENMQDLMRHVDDPILELSGLQAQNRESNPPSLTECAILTAAQAVYSLTR